MNHLTRNTRCPSRLRTLGRYTRNVRREGRYQPGDTGNLGIVPDHRELADARRVFLRDALQPGWPPVTCDTCLRPRANCVCP